jgi:hypothetical protein
MYEIMANLNISVWRPNICECVSPKAVASSLSTGQRNNLDAADVCAKSTSRRFLLLLGRFSVCYKAHQTCPPKLAIAMQNDLCQQLPVRVKVGDKLRTSAAWTPSLAA